MLDHDQRAHCNRASGGDRRDEQIALQEGWGHTRARDGDGEGTASGPPPCHHDRGGEEHESETVIALLSHPTTVQEEARMLSELIGTLLTPSRVAHAHCDLPCGVYDPAQARIEAQSVKACQEKFQGSGDPVFRE